MRSRTVWIVLGSVAAIGLAWLVVALLLVGAAPPLLPPPADVFGFAALKAPGTEGERPAIKRYNARDGAQLAYRRYDSTAGRVLIFVHGSSYHGGGYHALASHLSRGGAAQVILPNLRGHYLSGRRRGDVEYIGQLEDDLVDLIQTLRTEGVRGPITLGGHSSGGGLAIRFAGGAGSDLVSRYLLLSPVIPVSPAVRQGSAGGWANVHRQRLFGLLALNALGIHAFDGLPVVEFNKPEQYWDGTETLSYSYRLNSSYHPRYRYANDLRALDGKALLVVGENDEAVDASALRALFSDSAPRAEVAVLPGINHFGVFSEAAALEKIAAWLRKQP